MLDSQDRDDFDRAFRPLVVASLGSGVMAMGVLQFAGQSWGSFGDEARALVAIAARTAFLSFIMCIGVTLFAFMFRRSVSGVMRAAANGYGASVFLAGSFLCAGFCSQAMSLEAAGGDTPPDSVATFMGLAGVGFVLIVILAVTSSLWRVVFGAGSRAKGQAARTKE